MSFTNFNNNNNNYFQKYFFLYKKLSLSSLSPQKKRKIIGMSKSELIFGDCLEQLKTLEEFS